MLTTSLCPICKKEITAEIFLKDQVLIVKECPFHGKFESILENSLEWFNFCQKVNDKTIYDGVMIDITNICNIKCKYCYHVTTGHHRETQSILSDIDKYSVHGPIILTGGEPTTHPDFIPILQKTATTGQFWLLTNGVKLSDREFFESALPYLDADGVLMVGLSFHKESNGADFKFLGLCREYSKKIGTAFFVIDDLSQIDEALAVYAEFEDIICSFRIKAASNLGREHGAYNHIYTSEMVHEIMNRGGSIDRRYSNKISYASMLLNGKEIRLISWYDINNVDLQDIAGPPYTIGRDGIPRNLVINCLMESYNV